MPSLKGPNQLHCPCFVVVLLVQSYPPRVQVCVWHLASGLHHHTATAQCLKHARKGPCSLLVLSHPGMASLFSGSPSSYLKRRRVCPPFQSNAPRERDRSTRDPPSDQEDRPRSQICAGSRASTTGLAGIGAETATCTHAAGLPVHSGPWRARIARPEEPSTWMRGVPRVNTERSPEAGCPSAISRTKASGPSKSACDDGCRAGRHPRRGRSFCTVLFPQLLPSSSTAALLHQVRSRLLPRIFFRLLPQVLTESESFLKVWACLDLHDPERPTALSDSQDVVEVLSSLAGPRGESMSRVWM